MARRIVALFADTHAGHRLALMNPSVKLPEDGPPACSADREGGTFTPASTTMQRWLWENYTEDIRSVRRLAIGDEIIVAHVGDLTWGHRHPDGLVTTRMSDQPYIATCNFLPWMILDNVQTVRLIHGTESHEFGEGSASIQVAEYLKRQFPTKSVRAVRHSLLDIDGVLVDLAHKGTSTGIRTWLKGNVLQRNVRSMMMADLLQGREPVRVKVYAHYHEHIRELVSLNGASPKRECIAIILPAYCGLTHYAHAVTQSSYIIGCGMVALEIMDGHLALEGVHAYHRTIDLRTKEVL